MKTLVRGLGWGIVALVLLVAGLVGWQLLQEGYRVISEDPAVWEPVIAEFEEQDRLAPPEPGQILFLGSSSIRLWESLASDMRPVPALGRGFGGAKINDLRHFASRLIRPYQPQAIVLYIGGNDLSGSFGMATIENAEAERRYRGLLEDIDALSPGIDVYLVALKPTTRSWQRWPLIEAFNQQLLAIAGSRDNWHYVDANADLFDAGGLPREDLLAFDGMHLNALGYTVWGQALREALIIALVSQSL